MYPSNAPGFLIRRLQQISVQLFLGRTNGAGVSSVQYGALQVIERRPGIDQVTLSQRIDTDRTSTARIVDRLSHSGLIRRENKPGDRRTNALFIMEAGRTLLQNTSELADESQELLLSPLDPHEQDEFLRMLRKIVFAHSGPRHLDEASIAQEERESSAG